MSDPSPASGPALDRRLHLGGAVAIGLASMIGAGVFAVWAPAAAAAGGLLLVGLLVAAFVAFANAGSTAQLAARYPESGGAYRYGRERLGAWSGFFAGWGFVVGKTASCAAMAMTAAAYLAPAEWMRPVAVAAVVAVAAIDLAGVTRTARAATAIVAIVLAVLAIVFAAGVVASVVSPVAIPDAPAPGPEASGAFFSRPGTLGAYGVLQSAGLLFFAFAGYARVATLGEEVVEPARTIPRAIAISFGIALAVYAALAVVLLAGLGAERLAASDAPLADLVATAGWGWAAPVVQVAAGLASLGALLALLAGIGRTSLAMGRDRELPAALARISSRTHVPHVAVIVVSVAVVALVVVADLRGAIGFSSFGVLVYYFVANSAALTQPRAERRIPRWLSAVGAIGCLVLVAALPWPSVVAGLAVFAVGALVRAVALARRRRLSA
ncbi:APC family permease [Agromyces protaetiae]|uniref:APC family permease n=1 Tax=Agromyces protaetiae TaxID=2509455 RepID=A0A4P6FBQ6_9MICO|nr:APC family permease [Agromyces protaetiae]QAY73274.1 APC family permease [Agromyces protaetiae]